MQSKSDTSTLGQLKHFILQSLQIGGNKLSDNHHRRDGLKSMDKISPERALRNQNNYANLPTTVSSRTLEWQQSLSIVDQSLAGNSDYVSMESPRKPIETTSRSSRVSPRSWQRDSNYMNVDGSYVWTSPDYVNMDETLSGMRSSRDYVNLTPDNNEPRPLTRMNVTLHDQIWGNGEAARVVPAAPRAEHSLLSPPLKHINPNQFWYHADPLDISDSISDKSGSSGDTMIMMTSAEVKRNEENIERSRMKYENNKDKPDDLVNKCDPIDYCVADRDSVCPGRGQGSDILAASSPERSEELLEVDSVLDEGYGTDSRGSTTNSVSTPLSTSLSSLYSGDADHLPRQTYPKMTPLAMKRHIELIPKGRIANFRKVQFTTRRTKKEPDNNANSNSLQQKIMELAIIDEEAENESLTTSSGTGSEKNCRTREESGETSQAESSRTHIRSKTERTVRWLDEENAKKAQQDNLRQPTSATVQLRVKDNSVMPTSRPKSYSGHTTPLPLTTPRAGGSWHSSVSRTKSDGTNGPTQSHSEQVCIKTNLDLADDTVLARPNSQIFSDSKLRFQRHSVATTGSSLHDTRSQWCSEIDISKPNRTLEFCPSSQIYDRMRTMTRSHEPEPSKLASDVVTARNTGSQDDVSNKSNTQGRPVFATTADIMKLFQSQSKAESFVRAQRHSFHTFPSREEAETRVYGRGHSRAVSGEGHNLPKCPPTGSIKSQRPPNGPIECDKTKSLQSDSRSPTKPKSSMREDNSVNPPSRGKSSQLLRSAKQISKATTSPPSSKLSTLV